MKEIEMYFIIDEYFTKFKDPFLMKNKETVNNIKHDRPFFYAFKDKKNPRIYWMVPVSSQYTKYKKIYDKKIEKYGHCETIVFGRVINTYAAFLIQNICPATKKYLVEYLDSNNNSIRIDYDLAIEIEKNANSVLIKENKGIKIVFPNIKDIYRKLEQELTQD